MESPPSLRPDSRRICSGRSVPMLLLPLPRHPSAPPPYPAVFGRICHQIWLNRLSPARPARLRRISIAMVDFRPPDPVLDPKILPPIRPPSKLGTASMSPVQSRPSAPPVQHPNTAAPWRSIEFQSGAKLKIIRKTKDLGVLSASKRKKDLCALLTNFCLPWVDMDSKAKEKAEEEENEQVGEGAHLLE